MPAVEPGAVRTAARDLGLRLGVGHDRGAARGRRGSSSPAGAGPFARIAVGRDIEHTGLGGEHDPAVRRLEPAAGPKAVAVERRADERPVGERDRRRPVPRLGQALVEAVEAAQVVRDVAAPRTPPAPSSSARAAASGPPARAARARCRTSRCRSRRDGSRAAPSARSSPKSSDASCGLARADPVDVPAQRVDLAVVRDQRGTGAPAPSSGTCSC